MLPLTQEGPNPTLTKAHAICQLYINALRVYQQGRLGICADEKTGLQILPRAYPTQPVQPGTPAKHAYEYLRHGVRALLASFVGPTGHRVWHLGPTCSRAAWVAYLAHVVQQLPVMQRSDWVVDTLNTPWSRDVCRLVPHWCAVPYRPEALQRGLQRGAFLRNPTHQHGFHFTPKHGTWLNQVELWFRVLARRFLNRGDFDSGHDFAARWGNSLDVYTPHHAHPYRWTSTGQPLGRATPFRQTRRQRCQGRAWFSPQPNRCERAFSPPRPYKRSAKLGSPGEQ